MGFLLYLTAIKLPVMNAKEFILNLPQKVSPTAIEGMNTNFHFDLRGDDGGQYTVMVNNGQLSVNEGFNGDPNCKITAKTEDLTGIINGSLNPMMAVLTGKIKISNQSELIKYAKIFGLM